MFYPSGKLRLCGGIRQNPEPSDLIRIIRNTGCRILIERTGDDVIVRSNRCRIAVWPKPENETPRSGNEITSGTISGAELICRECQELKTVVGSKKKTEDTIDPDFEIGRQVGIFPDSVDRIVAEKQGPEIPARSAPGPTRRTRSLRSTSRHKGPIPFFDVVILLIAN